MQKVNFENKPSTNTPINATNLNLVQTNVENEFTVVRGEIDTQKVKYADIYFTLIPNVANALGIGTNSKVIDISSLNATQILDVSFNYASGNAVFVLKSNLENTSSIEVYGYRLSGTSSSTIGARARILYR